MSARRAVAEMSGSRISTVNTAMPPNASSAWPATIAICSKRVVAPVGDGPRLHFLQRAAFEFALVLRALRHELRHVVHVHAVRNLLEPVLRERDLDRAEDVHRVHRLLPVLAIFGHGRGRRRLRRAAQAQEDAEARSRDRDEQHQREPRVRRDRRRRQRLHAVQPHEHDGRQHGHRGPEREAERRKAQHRDAIRSLDLAAPDSTRSRAAAASRRTRATP